MFKFISILVFVYIGVVFTLPPKNPEELILKPKFKPWPGLKHFHLGYNSVVADSLWLRVIQNFDYCPEKPCNKGWVFQMIDIITDMQPDFRYAHRAGAEVLSISVEDKEGARLIYEKALLNYPNYWAIHYSAAYFYSQEMQNPERAAKLLKAAADIGGPEWLYSLAGKLYTQSGKLDLAILTLKNYLKEHPDGRSHKIAKERLAKLLKQKQELEISESK